VKNPFNAESGRRFLSPTKARRLSLCIIIAVAIGAFRLLFIDDKQGKKYLKTSTSIQKNSNDNIILASSSGTTDIQHRPSKQAGDAVGGNKEEGGEELQLNAAMDKFEMTSMSDDAGLIVEAEDRNNIAHQHQPSANANAANGRRHIKCFTHTTMTEVTPEEFYSEDSKCWHSFKADTVLFHVGKGGGGTLQSRFGKKIQFIHPRPQSSINKQLQNGPLRTLIVNVRDPVDRFISAFNWRNAVLCHPNDKRQKGKAEATAQPNKFCKEHSDEEILLRETYQSNPSVFAEALCHDSPSHSLAEKDYRQIGHSTTLTEWLDFLIDPRLVEDITDDGIQHLIVLSLEKRPGANETLFEKHIDNLMLQLLQNQYGVDLGNKMMRLAQEQEVKRGETHDLRSSNKQQEQAYLHSSEKFYNSTPPALTKLGECCLARHLMDDYRLIESMLGKEKERTSNSVMDPLHGSHSVVHKACSWGDEQQQQSCRGDLASMLMRRAKFLDESKGSCSAIISAGEAL